MEQDKIVWEATLDERFLCRAVRKHGKRGQREGLLTMRDKKDDYALCLLRDITFSFGAIYGPDVDDLLEWQKTCQQRADEIKET